MNKKVAIIGYGWVGKAMQKLFPDALVYLRERRFNDIPYNFTLDKENVNECDVAFICVPTPNKGGTITSHVGTDYEHDVKFSGEGELDISVIEEILEWLDVPLIVIRSTVNPGDCFKLNQKFNKNIIFQPEYLGETPEHPLLDTIKTKFLIIGSKSLTTDKSRELIDLYSTVYNANITIRQVTNYEAEIIKLSENRAIAFKVAECQELYDVCQKANVDYYAIRDAVYGDDPRFNLWWTFVFPDKRGFNSKCIPKDVYAWCAWAESLGYEPKITRGILEKNKEWIGGAK